MKKVGLSLIFLLYLILNKYFPISIKCPFYLLTGLYCPGCGITRMFKALLEGNIYQAFRYNPLVFIYIMGYLLYKIMPFNFSLKTSKKLLNFLLILTLFYGVLRNIPLFSFLAPNIV